MTVCCHGWISLPDYAVKWISCDIKIALDLLKAHFVPRRLFSTILAAFNWNGILGIAVAIELVEHYTV